MKLFGDVSQQDKDLAVQLELFEITIGKEASFDNERKAQLYVCLAHDWYFMGVESEGNRLLAKADQTCPGYFGDTMYRQTLADGDFDILVKNITAELARMLIELINSKQS